MIHVYVCVCVCVYVCKMHHIVFLPKEKSSSRDSLTIEVVVGRFGGHVESRYESENDEGQ